MLNVKFYIIDCKVVFGPIILCHIFAILFVIVAIFCRNFLLSLFMHTGLPDLQK